MFGIKTFFYIWFTSQIAHLQYKHKYTVHQWQNTIEYYAMQLFAWCYNHEKY